jgi:hypothetical protein
MIIIIILIFIYLRCGHFSSNWETFSLSYVSFIGTHWKLGLRLLCIKTWSSKFDNNQGHISFGQFTHGNFLDSNFTDAETPKKCEDKKLLF